MKKALQVASVASMIDQFNMQNISILQGMGYEVDVAANFDFGSTSSKERVEEFKKELKEINVNIFNLLFDRKVFDKGNVQVYKQLRKIIEENNYEIIHCHSPIGGVITRLAARKARKKGTKVIYTGHGFHFFKGAPFINWLVYYPVEWICSFFTDILITMNQEDYTIAKQNFKAKNIKYVCGVGVDTEKIINTTIDKQDKRTDLGIPEEAVMLLSVGELSKRKNHEVVIRALGQLKNKKIRYVICGKGALEEELKQLCKEVEVEEQVIFAGFRRDITEICKSADIFVFPSLQEGLPVALMEAMAAGIPCIVSKIRGNVDLIEEGKGGYLVNAKNVNGFSIAIEKLIKESKLHNEFGNYNIEQVKNYDRRNVEKEMKNIYKLQ